MAKVIASRRWQNSVTGATASVFGGLPYVSDADKANWAVVTVGYSIQNDDGTVGQGRAPYATEEAAQAVLDANPHAFKRGPGG